MAQDWDIKPRGDSCHDCETPFKDKEEFLTALTVTDSGYVRGDYCQECWQKRSDSGTIFSTWHGVYHMPPPPQEEALKKETAESILRKLMNDDDSEKVNVMYILAVMLERKKTLIEKDVKTTEAGEILRVYEHKKTGEMFLITDPRLKLDELEHVQEEVVVLLGGKSRLNPEQNAAEGETAETDAAAEETSKPDAPLEKDSSDKSAG